MAGDTKCGSPLAIFCIPTHFVGDTLSGTTLGLDITPLPYNTGCVCVCLLSGGLMYYMRTAWNWYGNHIISDKSVSVVPCPVMYHFIGI